ncbi:MAG: ATP-binding protein [Nannocystaceae bacterium]
MVLVAPAPVGFERSSVVGVGPEELDLEGIADFLGRRSPALVKSMGVEGLAQRLGILASTSSGVAPTVAGLMAFGTCPQLARPELGVSVVRVAGPSLGGEIRGREDLEGGLSALLDQTMAFVATHTQGSADLLRPGELRPEYPTEAVREAVVNALVHRDLRLSGRVSIRIFDDRLEVTSPGSLPAPLPLDELAHQGGLSLPRNPLLASLARGLGLALHIGRGLPVIRGALAAVTNSPVIYAASNHEVRVILPSPIRVSGAAPRLDN